MRLKVKPQFDEGKFVNKRSQQVVFSAARNISGNPKQLAARLTAREGFPPKSEIHDGRSETEKTQCVWKKTRTEKQEKV
jgi:hypothetical protein